MNAFGSSWLYASGKAFVPPIRRDYGINGRANLVAMLCRVAPWAYYEDYSAIVATKNYLRRRISREDPKLAGTNKLLDSLDGRLALQSERTNKGVRRNKSRPVIRLKHEARRLVALLDLTGVPISPIQFCC